MQITIQITSDDMDTGNNFFSDIEEAIDYLQDYLPESYTFYHISGYERLKDGTCEDTGITTIEEAKHLLDSYEVDYHSEATTLDAFIENVQEAWDNRHNDGGGSGWISKD